MYGIEFGNNQYSLPNNSVSTQSDLAAQMGMSVDTLQNYKMLADMILNLQNENSKLRALISNNFGRRQNDPAKDRKALATYVELKGYKNGENQWGCQNGTPKSSLEDIAKELNISKRNLQRALRIERNLTDSMKELLDTDWIKGRISKEDYKLDSQKRGNVKMKKKKMQKILWIFWRNDEKVYYI